MTEEQYRLLHAAVGMTTEAIEFLFSICSSIFENKPIDRANVIEELGDSTWYVGLALNVVHSTFFETFDTNDAKLESRHGAKFSVEKCETRDLEAERKILEKNS